MRLKPTAILALLLGGWAAVANAAPVFDEEFTAPIYTLGDAVPLGPGMLRHGQWSGIPKTYRPAFINERDGQHVVELRPTSSFKLGSRLIGIFGKDGTSKEKVSTGLRFEIVFRLSALPTKPLYIQVTGGDGKSKATAHTDENGELLVSFGGTRELLWRDMKPDTWYRLVYTLPPAPRTKSRYSASLYEGETLLQSKEGEMARSVEEGGNNYTAFDIQHGTDEVILQIRSIKAETLEATP